MKSKNSITSIKSQKYNRDRFSIFINEEYRFSLSKTVAADLFIGQELSDQQIADLEKTDQFEQAFSKGLHYLRFRPRSLAEMVRYMQSKGYSKTVVDTTIKRLQKYEYIDDDSFAAFWIENRDRHRPRGRFALRYELRAKGVSDSIIDSHLSGYDETDSAWRAISSKLDRWKPANEFELKKQIYAFLQRRGFTHATCELIWQRAKEKMEDF